MAEADACGLMEEEEEEGSRLFKLERQDHLAVASMIERCPQTLSPGRCHTRVSTLQTTLPLHSLDQHPRCVLTINCGGGRSAAGRPSHYSNALARLTPRTRRCAEARPGTAARSARTDNGIGPAVSGNKKDSKCSACRGAAAEPQVLEQVEARARARALAFACLASPPAPNLGSRNHDIAFVLDLAREVILVLLDCCLNRRAQIGFGQLRHLRVFRIVRGVRKEGQAQLFRCGGHIPMEAIDVSRNHVNCAATHPQAISKTKMEC